MAPDPLDALRGPDEPVAPSPAFAADLRRRLADLLGVPAGPASSGAAAPVLTHLRPYLVVDGGVRAIEFYVAAFGATVVGDAFIDTDGRVGHAELEIAGAGFYLADVYPGYGAAPQPGQDASVSLHLQVADADAVVAAAAAAGAIVEQPVGERGYGSRAGTVRDPFGHRWMIDAPQAELSDEEVRANMAEEGFTLETVDLGERVPATRTPQPDTAAGGLVPSVGYFTVDAPDGGRAAAFYGALLGWDARTGSQPDSYHVENIAPPGGIAGGADAPGVTVYFRVPDVHAAAARVRELGGQVLSETVYPSGGNAACLDDQGVPFQLWQPAPGYE